MKSNLRRISIVHFSFPISRCLRTCDRLRRRPRRRVRNSQRLYEAAERGPRYAGGPRSTPAHHQCRFVSLHHSFVFAYLYLLRFYVHQQQRPHQLHLQPQHAHSTSDLRSSSKAELEDTSSEDNLRRTTGAGGRQSEPRARRNSSQDRCVFTKVDGILMFFSRHQTLPMSRSQKNNSSMQYTQ